jgi:hypothetical protein
MPSDEQNLARLMQAALPPGRTRLDPGVRQRVLITLLEEQRRLAAWRRFPERVLVGISGLLAAGMAFLAACAGGLSAGVSFAPALAGLAVIVAINLVMMPVAALVVVLSRRRYA